MRSGPSRLLRPGNGKQAAAESKVGAHRRCAQQAATRQAPHVPWPGQASAENLLPRCSSGPRPQRRGRRGGNGRRQQVRGIPCDAGPRQWAGPFRKGKPFAMTSARRSSKRATATFRSLTRVLHVTRAPASRQTQAAALQDQMATTPAGALGQRQREAQTPQQQGTQVGRGEREQASLPKMAG